MRVPTTHMSLCCCQPQTLIGLISQSWLGHTRTKPGGFGLLKTGPSSSALLSSSSSSLSSWQWLTPAVGFYSGGASGFNWRIHLVGLSPTFIGFPSPAWAHREVPPPRVAAYPHPHPHPPPGRASIIHKPRVASMKPIAHMLFIPHFKWTNTDLWSSLQIGPSADSERGVVRPSGRNATKQRAKVPATESPRRLCFMSFLCLLFVSILLPSVQQNRFKISTWIQKKNLVRRLKRKQEQNVVIWKTLKPHI